ncbi:hypothetical protein V2J09_005148 [Rumex salicifolius]
MKFSDSPVIELPVGGAIISLQQDNGSMHVGTSVWPCSLVLVKFAERWANISNQAADNPYASLLDFRRKRAIEIGAGCGAAGMGLYLLGLHDVILTDIAPVMPALKRNLKRNKGVLNKSLKTAQLYWANSAQIQALIQPHGPFDIVFAADVVYIEETVKPLVDAMEVLVAEDGVVLLGYQVRSPEADRMFWEVSATVFEIHRVPHDHLHPEYAYEESDVFIFRKKKAFERMFMHPESAGQLVTERVT